MTSRTALLSLVAAFSAIIAASATTAAPPREDPDWPCQQRLVPSLGAAGLWPDAAAPGDWRAEPKIVALVEEIAPRRVSADEGLAAISAFAEGLGSAAEERKRLLRLVFAGLVEETNRERGAVIARLKELGRRQRELADIASRTGDELRAIPADATGDDAARRTDLEQRATFVTRAFESAQRTMRYACEAPTQLEARLGRYTEALKRQQ